MCGIAGVITPDGRDPPRAVLEALGRALSHRGPDGTVVEIHDGVGLVHTRLAIIDIDGGVQPLHADDGVALVANGEIYNDLELRELLGSVDYRTRSDCESALHLYRRKGETFAAGLRGMYALAIHDPARRQVVLARDPFGIKPLYYAETKAGLCFASEAQALVAAGLVTPRLNAQARDELLGLQFSADATTALDGIRRVSPGETLVIRAGRIAARHLIEALPGPGISALGESEALEVFTRAWSDSIFVHRRADVPYGMFLSGGIDSTAVLTMMARQEPRAVLAYTAAFPDTRANDERAAAAVVAKALGATHIDVGVTARDFFARLPAVAAALDDPVADYAAVPSFLLAERAKKDVKVILTGEGGDELFAGYGRYRAARRPWPLRKRTWRRGVLARSGVLRAASNWRASIARHEEAAARRGYNRLQAAQALDIATWLPDDLLLKVDRCLMAHGIEGRVPFLDPAVAPLAFALPDALKLRGGLGKWLLRRWVADALASYPAFAPKQGFSVPVGAWIAGEGARLAPLMAAHPALAPLCAPERVSALFRDGGPRHGAAQWLLLFYALWYSRHILGRPSDGDILSTLALT